MADGPTVKSDIQLTHGSLFDGFGGLRRGFEQAGITTSWTVELLDGQDITKYTGKELSYVDVISGGPPCQRVSSAAALHRQRTLQTLWPDMLRIVAEGKPLWVVVEQPKGGRSVIIQASQDLQRLGYGCAGRIVNSQHWVPQRRERWFLIGRMGVEGMAVWNYLYPDGQRVAGGGGIWVEEKNGTQTTSRSETDPYQGCTFDGSCPHCLRDGIFARVSARKFACLGAGNAVTTPVAKWIGEKIRRAESSIRGTV